MFHIELRETPHRLHRFNLTDAELVRLLQSWVRGEQLELGERVWSPKVAEILVLEGREIPVGRLTMGRGWSVAQREGTDVTERVLGDARETLAAAAAASAETAVATQRGGAPHATGAIGAGAGGQGSIADSGAHSGTLAEAATLASRIAPDDAEVLADALGLELLRNLGETPMSLVLAWRTAAQRHQGLPLGVALDLAQRAVASLASSRLVAVSKAGEAADRSLQGTELEVALTQIDSWTAESGAAALWLRRL